MTAQIATAIEGVLKPRGVGVVVEATHECMTTRGLHKRGVSMVTSKMLGGFREDARTRAEFLRFLDKTGRSGAARTAGSPKAGVTPRPRDGFLWARIQCRALDLGVSPSPSLRQPLRHQLFVP